jgi:hypothetical protein
MVIVLDVYDDRIMEFQPRHIVIGAGTQFYPLTYNDIDKGTMINNCGSLIQVKEPIDIVATKLNDVYSSSYNVFMSEMMAYIDLKLDKKKPKRKRRTKK